MPVKNTATLTTSDNREAVFSADQKTVFLTVSNTIYAYDVATGAAKGEWTVGKQLGGMDVTADGKYLIAADREPLTSTIDQYGDRSYTFGVYRLDLATGEVTTYTQKSEQGYDYSFFDVAVMANGQVALTQSYRGSGWLSLKTLDLDTGTFTALSNYYNQDSILTSTDDRKHILLAESNTSSAAIKLLDVSGNEPIQVGNNGSSGFNRGVQAISGNGNFSATHVYSSGLLVFDSNLNYVHNLANEFPSWQSTSSIQGLAFDASGAHLFVLDADANQVVKVSTTTWQEVATFDIGMTDPQGYQTGEFGNNLLITNDDRYMIVSVTGGAVRLDLTLQSGTDPSAFFSTAGYLAANADVAAAGLNAFEHYAEYGWREGRDPSALFDTDLYLRHNADVAAAGLNPLDHYLDFGRYEGRAAYAAIGDDIEDNGFDSEFYLLANADVAAAGMDALEHYQVYGAREGRDPNAWFDTSAYLEKNADVAAAGLNPLDHYHEFGWREGRDPSAAFDTKAYLAANPDVAAAQIDPLMHYLQFGAEELRSPQGDSILG